MKVALYYPWVYLKSGCERTIAGVLRHSRHDWTIYTNRFERESTFPELCDAQVVELARVSVDRSFTHVIRAGWTIGRQRLPLREESALVVFCEGLGDFATFRTRHVPALCVCLTPLRAAYDPHYRARYLALHGHSRARAGMLAVLRSVYGVVDRLAWRNYRHVIAISREVEHRIRRGGLLAPGCGLEVACPGIEVDDHRPTWKYGRYFLVPGRIMWTKNIELAIGAFQRMRTRPGLSDMRLVIAGYLDEKSRPYLARLRQLAGDGPGVEFVVSPGDLALFSLYRDAYAIAYPPLNEDWGLVPLEAMAFGKPVVAIDCGGPQETIVDGRTGYLVRPNVDDFAQALATLAASPDLTRTLGRAALKHVRRFEMRTFVKTLDDRVEAVVAGASAGADEPPVRHEATLCTPG